MVYTLTQWVMYFFLYCMLGWVFESTVVSISKHKFVNRGFMKGPFLPIYGSGALVILLATLPLHGNPIAIFFVGMAAATVLEYCTGVAMEHLFKVRYWDYSHKPFNFQGRICLTSSLAWGALSVFLDLFIQKGLEYAVGSLSVDTLGMFVFCLVVVFCYDFVTSFRSAINLRHLLEQNELLRREAQALRMRIADIEAHAEQVKDQIGERLDEVRDATGDLLGGIGTRLSALQDVPEDMRRELSERASAASAALEELRKKFMEGPDLGKLLKRNPNATSVNYAQAFMETLEAYKDVNERTVEQAEKKEQRFAQGVNFYKLFWVFFIGCVLGVVVETLFCLLTRGHYENRVGVIWGPLSPVYGVGCVALTLGLYFLRFHRDIHILFIGASVGSVVEYVCSWAQETFLGSTSWDYSNMPYNINGRICLIYALFWGVLAVYWIKDIFPRINYWILKAIPNKIGKQLTWFLCVLVAFDIGMSLLAQRRWEARLHDVPAQGVLDEFFDNRFDNRRMEIIFPNMTFHLDATPAEAEPPFAEQEAS